MAAHPEPFVKIRTGSSKGHPEPIVELRTGLSKPLLKSPKDVSEIR